MKLFFISMCSLVLLSSCSAQFDKLLKNVLKIDLSTDDVAAGLKEALSNGTSKGSDLLSQRDGYFKSIYKIYLPDDAKNVCIWF